MSGPDDSFERAARRRGARIVAGIDEVGRGPLAGPVTAAAVILDMDRLPLGLQDSKKLSAKRREALAAEIEAHHMVGLAEATVEEIDSLNILRASHVAMVRAIAALPVQPDHVLIDGNLIPRDLALSAEAVVKGDGRCVSIAAASIVAKIRRDYVMCDLAQHYPGYGWEQNAGYPTKCHRTALENLGVTPHHRRSFKPVHNILYQEKNRNQLIQKEIDRESPLTHLLSQQLSAEKSAPGTEAENERYDEGEGRSGASSQYDSGR